MRQSAFSGLNLDPRGTPPVTKWLALTLLVVSLLASITQRSYGFGIADLQYRVDAVLEFELWRLLTYPFVESSPFGLIISVLVLWLFGRWFEGQWGSRDFLRFFVASAVGAGLLAIPLGFIINALLPFRDVGVAAGPGPVFDAMLVALAVQSPTSNVLFGFVLPIRARTIVFLILAFHLIAGIQTGAATLGITLGGMGMGYLLTTGYWRPQRLFDRYRLWRMTKHRRSGLYVVPPPGKRDSTLH